MCQQWWFVAEGKLDRNLNWMWCVENPLCVWKLNWALNYDRVTEPSFQEHDILFLWPYLLWLQYYTSKNYDWIVLFVAFQYKMSMLQFSSYV